MISPKTYVDFEPSRHENCSRYVIQLLQNCVTTAVVESKNDEKCFCYLPDTGNVEIKRERVSNENVKNSDITMINIGIYTVEIKIL